MSTKFDSMISPDGKSARACDNCVRKLARWYCAADDAFLCQSCDSSVHSANPLARRHERVRLKIAAIKSHDDSSENRIAELPSWDRGFTRKARTPRQKKQGSHPLRLVPEISGDEENEEQLLYRVPIFDPPIAELCSSSNNNAGPGSEPVSQHETGFVPSEMDLAEFAADVESLLGKGLDEESFGLGILDCDDEREKGSWGCFFGSERVKVEDEENVYHEAHGFVGLERETFELNFDYDYPITGDQLEDDDDHKGKIMAKMNLEDSDKVINDGKKIFLRLDYQGVMSAWDDHKSPWMTGKRPDFDSNQCWPHCMGTCGTMHVYGEMGTMMSGHTMADGGREARVSRYREKRRTRLFSKKIRYEVRKLNAEKRPRMKGRFVKRENLVAPAFSLLNK
ncbi:hypothetical protein ACS0TY_033276 [Phlomoides rotata]